MRIFGLIGNPIDKSLSPHFFQKKFEREGIKDAVYQLFPITSLDEFPSLIESEEKLVGLNVTHPYKEAIIPYLDTLTEEAKAIGAVNTIGVKREGGRCILTGHNTDCTGFQRLLDSAGTFLPDRALLFGTGGAAKAVAYALRQRGIKFSFVSRSAAAHSITYQDITPEIIRQNRFLINATPIGMWPDTELCLPLPYTALTPEHLLIDLIYNPAETAFLREGLVRGARCLNGMAMLEGQAEASWQFWSATPSPCRRG